MEPEQPGEEPGMTTRRRPPGPIAGRLARLPRHLYRLGLGRLLGRRFVLIEHTGRRSGLPRQTVVEVLRHDDTSLDVAAAWGTRSDWYRNLRADPQARISTGPVRHQRAEAAVVGTEEAADVFAGYAEHHPRAAKALSKALDLPLGDPQRMAAAVPIVRFTLA
jgi:deazaflavin-dependent oxidoreductase (nitroreductase family)